MLGIYSGIGAVLRLIEGVFWIVLFRLKMQSFASFYGFGVNLLPTKVSNFECNVGS